MKRKAGFRISSCIVLLLSMFLASCSQMDAPENKEDYSDEIGYVEEEMDFVEGVKVYGPQMKDYIKIIDEETIHLSLDVPEDKIPEKGDIIFYDPEESGSDMFVGRVVSISQETDKYVVKTEMPSMKEIFGNLSVNLEMNSSNTTAVYHPSSGDDVISCRVVDNSVWDNITVLCDEASEVSQTPAVKSGSNKPVDITLELEVKNDNFEGKVYIGLKGFAYINRVDDFVMNISTRIGLNGTLGVGVEGGKEIPLFNKTKRSIMLWTNKILALKLDPQLLFVCEGKIRLEAGLNFELINTDFKMSHSTSDGFRNSSVENKRNNYFRLKSLHSSGKFGLALSGDLYAILLSEKLFRGGTNLKAGVKFGGEKNVGIQFPGIANFDFQVVAEPFLSIRPFLYYMSPTGLVKHHAPEMTASIDAYSIGLMPGIEGIQHEFMAGPKLSVEAEVKGSKTSFMVSKQEGIALFEKGAEEPVKRERIMEITSKAKGGEGVSFDLEDNKEYEIAVYSESENDGFVYGERINIEKSLREVLEEFYHSAGGENWYRNDNWCTDKPIESWYGVGIHYGDYLPESDMKFCTLYLPGNNLSGDAYLGPNSKITYIEADNNSLSSLTVNGCEELTYIRMYNNPLTGLVVSDCGSLTDLIGDSDQWQRVSVSRCPALEGIYLNCVDYEAEPAYSYRLDVSDCASLKSIDCVDTGLSELNLSGTPALERLNLDNTKLKELNLSDLHNLDRLNCHDGQLEVVNVRNCTKLEKIMMPGNPLVSVDMSGCTSLRYFDVKEDDGLYVNTLKSLNFSGCSSLGSIGCYYCDEINYINVCGCSKLNGISVEGGAISTLTISGDAAFSGNIYCNDIQLRSLDVSTCTGLKELSCYGNQLTSLDLSGHSQLKSLSCGENPLSSLNLSGCSNLEYLDCRSTHLNQVITDFYDNLKHLKVFSYDQKYYDYYWTDSGSNKVLHYSTRQYGWWYPGEPGKGYHGK